MLKVKVDQAVREVPDFPKPGIMFKDITPILQDPKLCREIVQDMAAQFVHTGISAIVGVESRGFLFGMMLAQELNVPFVAVRKKGKLPYATVSYSYELEYGTAEMEMHVDAIKPGDKVLIHDDLLATGGTAAAAAELIQIQGGEVVGFSFVIELSFLSGISKLEQYSRNTYSTISY